MGARFNGDSGREHSHFEISCFKNDMRRAVSILGDAVSNASLSGAELEMCKQEIAADHQMSST